MRQRVRRNPQAQVHLLQRFLVSQGNAGVRVRRLLHRGRIAPRQGFEVLPHQRRQPLVGEVSGRGYQHVRRRVNRVVKIAHHGAVEPPHALRRAQNRLAQRVILPEIRREDLVDQVVRAILLHLDFFQDDALFLLDIFFAEHGVQHQVGQNVEGLRQVLVHHLSVEAHQFFRRKSVQIAAQCVHAARDVLGRPAGRTLEQHVLDEVRDAVVPRRFAPRAGTDPDAHRHAAHVRHNLGDYAHAVVQRAHFDIP